MTTFKIRQLERKKDNYKNKIPINLVYILCI